ncbi:MAG: hypothetical protein ACFFD4_20235 [Candidatus Odinarchaeota archaeon]
MEHHSFDIVNNSYTPDELKSFFKATFTENFLGMLPEFKERHIFKIFFFKVLYIPVLVMLFYFLSLTGMESNVLEIIFDFSLILVFIGYLLITEALNNWQMREYGFSKSEKAIINVSNAHRFYHYNHHFVLLFLYFLSVNLRIPLIAAIFYTFGFILIFYRTKQLESRVSAIVNSDLLKKALIPYPSRIPLVEPLNRRKILVSTSFLLNYYSEKPTFPVTEPLILYFRHLGRITGRYRFYHVIFIQILVPILVSVIVSPFIPRMVNDQLFIVLLASYTLFIVFITISGWLLNRSLKRRIKNEINVVKENTGAEEWKDFVYLNKSVHRDLGADEQKRNMIITYYLGVFPSWMYINESIK